MPATFLYATTDVAELPQNDRPQIAMVGRSNVGKSSMINHLVGQHNLARVSGTPGKTQTINLYEIDKRFYLVDLPGYGYAKTSKEQRNTFLVMIQKYLTDTTQLRLVLLIIDARIPLTEPDSKMLVWLRRHKIPFMIVLNRMDVVSPTAGQKLHALLEKKYPTIPRLEHSMSSGKSRNELWGVVTKAARAKSSSAVLDEAET